MKKLTLAALLLALVLSGGRRREETAVAAAPQGSYILREYEGCVAIYCGAEEAPSTVTDIEVCALPSHDRALLGAGLCAADRQELSRLLEDLGS